MNLRRTVVLVACWCLGSVVSAAPIKVLIVDGQNNHKWRETTPELVRILEGARIFQAKVATSPADGEDMDAFKPDFAEYDVVLSNYNGAAWPTETRAAFEEYVREGGGFVVYHAADNAFPDWAEYNVMIGVGGWRGRTEEHGPSLFWADGRLQYNYEPGRAGHHGKRHEFMVTTRDKKHPVMKGLPPAWMHAMDELYDTMRGPAKRVEVLATAYSAPNTGGSGRDEPMLMTVQYGKGRVFHTMLGHDVPAMKCVGFIVTLQRGVEWAATGKVKQKMPRDFPNPMRISLRE